MGETEEVTVAEADMVLVDVHEVVGARLGLAGAQLKPPECNASKKHPVQIVMMMATQNN